MTSKGILFLIISMVLFIPLSVSAEVQASFTQVLLPIHLFKLIIIPIILWLMKLIITDAIDRYNLIRNLYSEIMRNYALFSGVKEKFPKWEADNIDGKKEPALMERLTWNKVLYTKVYDCSQTNIIKSLWKREITDIHELYSNFIELDRLLISVATEINEARREYIYGTPVESDNVNELLVSTREHNIKLVSDKVKAINILLNKVCEKDTGRECAREQFYSRWFYRWHVSIIAIFGIIVILLFLY